MDFLDRLRLGQDQKVVVALLMAGAADEAVAAKMILVEAKPLDLRAHRAIENQDAFARRLSQSLENIAVACKLPDLNRSSNTSELLWPDCDTG